MRASPDSARVRINEMQKKAIKLIVFGDLIGNDGRKVSGRSVFQQLFKANKWLFMSATRQLAPGDTLLFYQNRVGAVGEAKLVSIEAQSARLPGLDLAFYTAVVLSDCQQYESPVSLRPLISDLAFIKNKRYWGQSLRSSPRSISPSDYDLIRARRTKASASPR